MNPIDSFLEAYHKEYPQAKTGQVTIEEFKKFLNDFQEKENNQPLDHFDGLSPYQMHILLYQPLSNECLLQFDKSFGNYIDQVPIFRLSELLLKEIEKAGKIKLTAKGNLPVGICELLYKQDLIKWKYMKYVKKVQEDEIPYLSSLKEYLFACGIVKKLHNKLSLTKNGLKFMKESKTERFTTLLLFFGSHFHWGNFYNIPDGGRAGQLGWAYSLWLLHKYGDEPRETEFYSNKLIEAFEKDLKENRNGEVAQKRIADYHYAYAYRFFEIFANWFGLVNIERRKVTGHFHDQLIVTKADLFNGLFQ